MPSNPDPRPPPQPPSPSAAEQPQPSQPQPPTTLTDIVRNVPGDGVFIGPAEPTESGLGRGEVISSLGSAQGRGAIRRTLVLLQRLMIGPPLATAQEHEERIGKTKALAIFASDNISSSAYATEEIMRVLILAGVGALALTMPITVALIALVAIVAISYLQVIRAHPRGGGSYAVARANLGIFAGLTAAAALLIDYILTVAVSTAAGVAALTSAFPALFANREAICVAVIVLMTILNLRGVRESGTIFAAPTYLYVVSILLVIAYGFVEVTTNQLPQASTPTQAIALEGGATQALTAFLILRAFASGAVALSGLEAVSNGVPAFKPPEVRNAQVTLISMAVLFSIIFFGISFLAGRLHIVPDPREIETVNSQVVEQLLGTSPAFFIVQFATSLILILAANTAFNGFPRLASILARDRFLPRTFQHRGDRLAYTAGIVVLALIAIFLIIAFRASVTALIPLYTVGVFIAFTLSQAGLVRHWWQGRATERGWRWRLAINALGALTTGVVLLVVSVTKFVLGAWMVLVLLPLLIGMMWKIHRHYQILACAVVPETPLVPGQIHPHIVVPVAEINTPARQAIAFGLALSHEGDVVAVHVADSAEAANEFQREWNQAGLGVRLVVIESPFRSLIGPLLAYVEAFRKKYPNDPVMVMLPEYVPSHWWEHLLHNQTALRLKAALLFFPGVVVTSIPYHLSVMVPDERKTA